MKRYEPANEIHSTAVRNVQRASGKTTGGLSHDVESHADVVLEATAALAVSYPGKSGRLAKAVFKAFDQPSEMVRS